MKFLKVFIISSLFSLLSLTGYAATRHVSPQGNPQADGIQAPTTLEQALQLANNGDTVILGPGTYLVQQTLVINHGIRLTSSGGRPDVIVRCEVNGSCLNIDIASQAPLWIDKIIFHAPGGQINTALDITYAGVVKIHEITFHHFHTSIKTSGQNTQLSVVSSRFHFIESVGIDVNDGSYLKKVEGSRFYSTPVDGFIITTAIRYAGSDYVLAQHGAYRTEISHNYFKGFSTAGLDMGAFFGMLNLHVTGNEFEYFKNPIWQDDVEYPAHAVLVKASNSLFRNRVVVSHNSFLNIEGTAINLDFYNARLDGKVEYNTIEKIAYGIYVRAFTLGGADEPFKIRNNFVKDYFARSSIVWNVAPGLGIHLQSMPGGSADALVSYNTVIATGNETMPMVPGSALHVYQAATAGQILIVNNLLHVEGGLWGSYGLHFEGAGAVLPSGIVYEANNADGFSHDGRNTNYIVTHYIREYDVIPPLSNTQLVPPFMQNSYDLSSPFPADSILDSIAFDLEGQARGANPDIGAYQH
jgi:hypothetical protein